MSGIQLTMTRKNGSLVPTSEQYEEELRRLPQDREVVVTVKRARNPGHLRTFFQKLREIINTGQWDGDVDSLRNYISIGTGNVETIIDNTSSMVGSGTLALAEEILAKYGIASKEGQLARAVISMSGPKTYLVPKSIALESMDEDAFHDFNKQADRFLAERGIDIFTMRGLTSDYGGRPSDPPAQQAEEPALETEPEMPATQDESEAPAPTAEDTVNATAPLGKRLKDLAIELATVSTLAAHEQLWKLIKDRAETKALFRLTPNTVKLIVERSKDKAFGRLDADRYWNAVNIGIDMAINKGT